MNYIKENNEKNEKKLNKKVIYIILIILAILSIIFGIVKYFSYSVKKDTDDAKEYISDNLINENNKFEIVEINTSNGTNKKQEEIVECSLLLQSERIDKVKEYQKTNSDIVGWLEIPNTNISYPVVQGKDNSYYMRRNFKKRYTINGSLFLDKDFKWNPNSSNLLIYGHNNRGTNEMFVELLKYKDESFYKEHPIIRFTTNEEDAIYEIISVFKSRVYYKRETDVFRYYYFVNAENEEEYNYFVEESKKASLYDIDATAEYGDQLITLSTCEYSEKDGRFVVVGRKIDN